MIDSTPIDRDVWQSERRRLAHIYRIEMPILPYEGIGRNSILVEKSSPLDLRKAVEMYANATKRECGYASLARAKDLETRQVWLIPPRSRGPASFVAAGAVSFEPFDGSWELRWMYFHPFQRGNQIIDFHWSSFCSRYGDFTVQQPITRPAQALLERNGWDWCGPTAAS